ncbi:unnamed protein product [Linum trigynum]|uniref:Protein kinase domain-containing protein n=1 Tax=Linum trigynum TaxID=586398 RepID=A0AAV2FYI5_9ROSI
MNFNYETLEKATDYFSLSKKLGQGGADTVFIGSLPNNQTVAVKRLIFNTSQWVEEFFNEVNLISGIQHKNLVKLLGCSIEGPESLLVYAGALPGRGHDGAGQRRCVLRRGSPPQRRPRWRRREDRGLLPASLVF